MSLSTDQNQRFTPKPYETLPRRTQLRRAELGHQREAEIVQRHHLTVKAMGHMIPALHPGLGPGQYPGVEARGSDCTYRSREHLPNPKPSCSSYADVSKKRGPQNGALIVKLLAAAMQTFPKIGAPHSLALIIKLEEDIEDTHQKDLPKLDHRNRHVVFVLSTRRCACKE